MRWTLPLAVAWVILAPLSARAAGEEAAGAGQDATYWAKEFIDNVEGHDGMARLGLMLQFNKAFPLAGEERAKILAEMCRLEQKMEPEKADALRRRVLDFGKVSTRNADYERELRRWATTLSDHRQRQMAAGILFHNMDRDAYGPLRATVLVCDPGTDGSYPNVGWAWIRENAPEAEKPLRERLAQAGTASAQPPPIEELEGIILNAMPPRGSPSPKATAASLKPSPARPKELVPVPEPARPRGGCAITPDAGTDGGAASPGALAYCLGGLGVLLAAALGLALLRRRRGRR